nr:hypothetical protein [Tanacetum cinerariifolium]
TWGGSDLHNLPCFYSTIKTCNVVLLEAADEFWEEAAVTM